MEFFIPNTAADELEAKYAQFANWVRVSTPPVDRRIAAITFVHDGVTWVAEVGQQLRGERYVKRRRGGKTVSVRETQSDRAVVLAIFASVPYFVFTDARPLSDKSSEWVNPFMAGEPSSVKYFSVPKTPEGPSVG